VFSHRFLFCFVASFSLTGEETKRKGSDLEISSDGTHTPPHMRTHTHTHTHAALICGRRYVASASAEPNIMADGEEEAYFQNQREDETEHALRERN